VPERTDFPYKENNSQHDSRLNIFLEFGIAHHLLQESGVKPLSVLVDALDLYCTNDQITKIRDYFQSALRLTKGLY